MDGLGIEYAAEPTPYVFIPELIDKDIFGQLTFPYLPEKPGGRTGRDLFPGEEGWAELMQTPGWKELSTKFTSEAFVLSLVKTFAGDIRRFGANFDPDKAYCEPYIESRREANAQVISTTHDPHALFVRFDLQAIGQKYGRGVHCDWPRRLFGGVLFMTDAEDEGLEGGEFGIYSDELFRDDRVCHKPKLERSFPIVKNTGVIFLNCNRGFHGPLKIQKLTGLRKWIYFSISSRRDLWRPAAVKAA